MMRIFIGYDPAEAVAYHVAAHSIIRRASVPVSITPIARNTLTGFYQRERGPLESTEFSISRFLCPALCDFSGFSVWMDCDMVVLADVAELGRYMTWESKGYAAQVVKHRYVPARERKFLDQDQSKYAMKNWSSFAIFSNGACRALTPDYVQKAPGLDLHQFKWCREDEIGELPKEWNFLVGEENQCDPRDAQVIHYTNGTPCFQEYRNTEHAQIWLSELEHMQRVGR